MNAYDNEITNFLSSSCIMKVIIFGSSGMVGKGVLLECIDHEAISEILVVSRTPSGMQHAKLKEVLHDNFTDFSAIADQLKGFDACFFCLGVSANGLNEAAYRKITYDFTLAAAKTLVAINANMWFIYVSGMGTDSTEKGRLMWARIKGKTENDLLNLGFKGAVMFRPGMIIPLRGIESRTPSYQKFYYYFKGLLMLIRSIFPNSMNDTTQLGLAMINVALNGSDKKILFAADINSLATK